MVISGFVEPVIASDKPVNKCFFLSGNRIVTSLRIDHHSNIQSGPMLTTRNLLLFFIFIIQHFQTGAQLYTADNGDGTYTNPVLYADYSDPDVIRVGDDYYMVASSFTCQPGVPVLHSKDLINWRIIN